MRTEFCRLSEIYSSWKGYTIIYYIIYCIYYTIIYYTIIYKIIHYEPNDTLANWANLK